jgi:hypothetical protein
MNTEIIYVTEHIRCPFVNKKDSTKCERDESIKVSPSVLNRIPVKCPLRKKEVQVTLPQGI